MSTRVSLIVAALLMASAASAGAQQTMPPPEPTIAAVQSGSIDVGARYTDINGDQARYQRFRDERNGAFLDRMRFDREGSNWLFNFAADHVGYRDQCYTAQYRGGGKLQISFQWDQVPLFYSQDTRTLYSAVAPGELRIDDNIQKGIQAGTLKLADAVGAATGFDSMSRRDTAHFNLIYRATRDLDVRVDVTSARRQGNQPFFASFGFSDAVEVPLPVDNRTTDMNAGVEWANQRGMFSLAYNASWFDNTVQTLVWDNPLKFTDSTFPTAYSSGAGTSQGRMALWPSNNVKGIATTGGLNLPGHSRLTGNVAFNVFDQNQPLLPFTINTAIPAIPLDRATAEAQVRALAMNYVFTSRPNRYVWLNARYRFYDLANRTPFFPVDQYVRMDQVLEPFDEGGPDRLEYTRHNLDVDASFTPIPFTALKIGFGRESDDRTHRIFATTNENIVRASIDSVGLRWVTLRGIYEHSARRGSGLEGLEDMIDMGEQPTLQHFDIADRNRNRFSALVQLTPASLFGLTASVSTGRDDYMNSGFGLRSSDTNGFAVTADVMPSEAIGATVSYAYDKYSTLQNSRSASNAVQFVDATRNWSMDTGDRTHTLNANLDLLKVLPKTDIRLGYSLNRSTGLFIFGQPANSSLAPLKNLPDIRNNLTSGTIAITRFINPRLGIGLTYWYDRYFVDDWAMGTQTIKSLSLPGSMFLGYVVRPYTAHSVWLHLFYVL